MRGKTKRARPKARGLVAVPDADEILGATLDAQKPRPRKKAGARAATQVPEVPAPPLPVAGETGGHSESLAPLDPCETPAERQAEGGEKTAPDGIECPACGCQEIPVETEKPFPGGKRRVRVCRHCGREIRTLERDKEDLDEEERRARSGGRKKWGGGAMGLVCNRCHGTDFDVRDTDRLPGKIRRYRICKTCGHEKTTYEQ